MVDFPASYVRLPECMSLLYSPHDASVAFHPLNNRGISCCTPSLIIPVVLGEWFFYKIRNGDNEPEKFLVLLGIYGIQDWFFVANWIWNFTAHSQLRFLKQTQSCLKNAQQILLGRRLLGFWDGFIFSGTKPHAVRPRGTVWVWGVSSLLYR